MQNFIEVKNGNPGFQGAWLKPENLGLTEALIGSRWQTVSLCNNSINKRNIFSNHN